MDDFELDPAQLEDNQDLLDQQQQILIDEAVRMEGKVFFGMLMPMISLRLSSDL